MTYDEILEVVAVRLVVKLATDEVIELRGEEDLKHSVKTLKQALEDAVDHTFKLEPR